MEGGGVIPGTGVLNGKAGGADLILQGKRSLHTARPPPMGWVGGGGGGGWGGLLV